eukprot:2955854-Rhodomonas_salina.1
METAFRVWLREVTRRARARYLGALALILTDDRVLLELLHRVHTCSSDVSQRNLRSTSSDASSSVSPHPADFSTTLPTPSSSSRSLIGKWSAYLAVLGDALGLLDILLSGFGGQRRDVDADYGAVVVGREPQVAGQDRALDVLERRRLVRLDRDHAGALDLNGGDLIEKNNAKCE